MPIPTELFATIMERISPDSAAVDSLRVWQALFDKFAPLLGPLSVELLFARALAHNKAAFPWLPQAEPNGERLAFDEFGQLLAQYGAEDVIAVNQALLASYTSNLAGLIGMRLTTVLLTAAFVPAAANKNMKEDTA